VKVSRIVTSISFSKTLLIPTHMRTRYLYAVPVAEPCQSLTVSRAVLAEISPQLQQVQVPWYFVSRRHNLTKGQSMSYSIINVWSNSVVSLAAKAASFPYPAASCSHPCFAFTFTLVSHLQVHRNIFQKQKNSSLNPMRTSTSSAHSLSRLTSRR
jgi:hypothetical protein